MGTDIKNNSKVNIHTKKKYTHAKDLNKNTKNVAILFCLC
jgi:hypothetical protein